MTVVKGQVKELPWMALLNSVWMLTDLEVTSKQWAVYERHTICSVNNRISRLGFISELFVSVKLWALCLFAFGFNFFFFSFSSSSSSRWINKNCFGLKEIL